MIDHEMPTGLEPDFATEGTRHLLFHSQMIEKTFIFVVQMNARRLLRRESLHEVPNRLVLLPRVDPEPINFLPKEITHDAETQTQVGVEQCRRPLLFTFRQDVLPEHV